MPDRFFYVENQPLIFTDAFFWLLFGALLVFYQFIHQNIRLRNFVLLIFSLYFYYLSGGYYVSLLLISTALDFYIGKGIYKSENESVRKLLVRTSVVVNLLFLAYFKYTFFFADTYNEVVVEFLGLTEALKKEDYLATLGNFILGGQHFDTKNIFLPVGISFYTFQTISYSVDIYRRRIKPLHNMLDFAFFVSFFPQLVAGPIVRANEFVDQIYQKFALNIADYNRAIYLILAGLFKKIFISDFISSNYVDRIFEDPARYSGFEVLMGVYGYAMQIYCDFSGYTDVAIGLAILLGFELPKNFESPYKADSITDFWRRWHISLSTWLKDYLYIPLGGNRQGNVRTYVNLFLTMVLGGLWHGAAWRFVLWGVFHGGALALHKLYINLGWDKKLSFFSNSKFLTSFVTFHFVCFCWIYFRADSIEKSHLVMNQVFTAFYFDQIIDNIVAYYKIYAVITMGFILHWLPTSFKTFLEATFSKTPDLGKAFVITLIILLIYQVKSSDLQPFIYFQF